MIDIGRVVIVGASLAGLRTAEFLRRSDFEGSITLLGAERHLPYDRPPLSKQILRREWEPERLALRKKSYDELGLDLRLGTRATSLDSAARQVVVDDGQRIPFDRLVVATGARPKTLPKLSMPHGVFTLRTLDDALAVRDALTNARRVAVIGAGFIGAEVAASAMEVGANVVMVEALDVPLGASVGSRVGRALQRAHERRGIEVRCAARVTAFVGEEKLTGLVLNDGEELPCDVAVVGIGVEPEVAWLEGSDVELEDGVRCDATCESSVPGVFAAGDVTRWYHPLFEEHMRVEHWTNAVEQARHVASALLVEPGCAGDFASVPLFWSDQFDIKIQGVGIMHGADEPVITAPGGDEEKLIALFARAERLIGAVAFNQPAKVVRLRQLIGERGGLAAAREIAES